MVLDNHHELFLIYIDGMPVSKFFSMHILFILILFSFGLITMAFFMHEFFLFIIFLQIILSLNCYELRFPGPFIII
jgi:hypothetical protein